MSNPRLYKQIFFSNSTWSTPAGVRFVIVTGCGGGGGGGGGAATSGAANIHYYATGGSGGQPAPTSTQIVEVTPGITYTITIGLGGAGGGFTAVPNYNDGGGKAPGNVGSAGGSTVFGGVFFPGGQGGARGEIVYPAGPSDPNDLQGRLLANREPATFCAAPGATRLSKGGGGGGGGGTSNNIYSAGGGGGQGAFGFDGYPFSTGGGGGGVGAGGGGGGGGEGRDYNNTHDGSAGGPGGSGFVEISWIQ